MKFTYIFIALVAGTPVPKSDGIKGILESVLGNSENNGSSLLAASSTNGNPSITDEEIAAQAKKGFSNRNSLPNQDQGFFSGVQSTSGSFNPHKKSRNPHSYHNDGKRNNFGHHGDSRRQNNYDNRKFRYDSDRNLGYDNEYNVRSKSVYRRNNWYGNNNYLMPQRYF